MPEYTYKDIIIDPTSDKAKNCIGKMVYYADNPSTCLSNANNEYDNFCGTLIEIDTTAGCPFVLESRVIRWACIIPKKEEPKPEWVPFKSISEFLEAYEDSTYSIACDSVEHKLLSRGGIWLKYKATDTRLVVTEMWGNGLTIGSDTAVTRWNELLKYCEFLDGSPCGKLKEADNA